MNWISKENSICFQVAMWKEKFLSPHTIWWLDLDTWTIQLDHFSYRQNKTPPSPRKLGTKLRSTGGSQVAARSPRREPSFPRHLCLGNLGTNWRSVPLCEWEKTCNFLNSSQPWREAVTQGSRLQGPPCTMYLEMWAGEVLRQGSQSPYWKRYRTNMKSHELGVSEPAYVTNYPSDLEQAI